MEASKSKNEMQSLLAPSRKEKSNIEYDMLFKIVVTGDSNAGKSRLLERFTKNSFKEDSQLTIGVEFTTKHIELKNGVKVKLQLWDTAGSEQYRAITTGYYRGSHAVLLIYDITNLTSFINLKNYWLQQVRDSVDEYCVVWLAGTKCDVMFNSPETREVLREQAELLAKD